MRTTAMNATFRHPSPDEVQAYVRRAHRERSAFIARSLRRLFARLTGRPSAAVESLPPRAPARADDDSHRLAA